MPFLPVEAYGSSLYIHRITFLVLCPAHNACVLRALPCVYKFFWRGQVKSCCASPVRLRLVALRFLSRTSELMCPCRWVPPFTASSGQTLQCPLCLVALLAFVLSDFVVGLLLKAFLLPNGPAALWWKANDYLGEAVVWTVICWLQHKIAL